MDTTFTAEHVIQRLGLVAHPEGGWYRESFRDEACSAIWFLLKTDERSHWHRVHGAAEIWHHYLGDPLRISIADGAAHEQCSLGADLAAGERPQVIVPAGAWQSAEPIGGDAGFTLAGCTVAPPFQFDHFELADEGWSP